MCEDWWRQAGQTLMVWWWVLGSALVIMVGRRWLRSVEQPSEGDGPTPSREGSSATGGTNQVWSRAQTLGLGSVGKGLATGSERRNFHGLVETLFWRLKRGTQHGGSINASVRAHKHTVSLFLLPSHTQNPPTAGRRATAIAILP